METDELGFMEGREKVEIFVRIVDGVVNCINDASRCFILGRRGKILLGEIFGGVKEKVNCYTRGFG